MTLNEAARSIHGAWLLAWMDRSGALSFENSVDAFWKSFWAAAFTAPIYVILVLLRLESMVIGVPAIAALMIYMISYVINWMAFPFIMFYLSRTLGRDEFYCRYIAAYNWATFLQILLLLATSAAVASDLLPPGVEVIITLSTVQAIFVYKGFIANAALGVTFGLATALVALDFVLGLTLEVWTIRLLQATPAISGG